MNKEEMEKKRNEFALKSFNGDPLSGFKAGWDACAEEYEKEIERLKSWEHFKKTLSVMQTFQSLGDVEKEAINLMIDGIKFRKQKGE